MAAGHGDDYGMAALGLVGVAVGTMMFKTATRNLGWHWVAVSLALYGAGWIASHW